MPRDPDALRTRIRTLTAQYKGGGEQAFEPFLELCTLLLSISVMRADGMLRLYTGPRHATAEIGGWAAPTEPVPLNDGRYLRVTYGLYLGRSERFGLDDVMKTSTASLQYQADREGTDWVFRYDYLREPQDESPHPLSHVQVRGDLRASGVLDASRPLERVHFPTARTSIEAVIRLLADQFDVPCNEPRNVWRRALADSEQAFLEIARQPLSGPER